MKNYLLIATLKLWLIVSTEGVKNDSNCNVTVNQSNSVISDCYSVKDIWFAEIKISVELGELCIRSYKNIMQIQNGYLQRKKIPNILALNLENSQIENIEPGTFECGHDLLDLDLSFNLLQQLNLSVFKDISKLRALNMANNPIKEHLKGQSFPLPSLNILNLDSCELTSLDSDLFRNLSVLLVLKLDNNNFAYISPCMFSPLINLKVLSLNMTKLTSIDPTVFFQHENLEFLFLGNNPIKYFEKNKQFINPSLKVLYLSNCEISSLDPTLFTKLPKLTHLFLYNNSLTTLDWKGLIPLTNMRKISLAFNPWHCDCQIGLLMRFLIQMNITIVNFENPDPICATAVLNGFTGRKWSTIDSNKLFCPPHLVNISVESSQDTETVLLHCDYSGHPVPEVKWTKDGTQLVFQDEEKYQISTSPLNESLSEDEFTFDFRRTLSITNIDFEDEGSYECLVLNPGGEARRSIFLNLNYLKESYTNIAFYKFPFRQTEIFQTKIEDHCQVLPLDAWRKVESVKTDSCVILFPTETCEAKQGSLKVDDSQGQVLLSFANDAQSFQSCKSYEVQNKLEGNKVKFYTNSSEDEQIIEEIDPNKCKNISKKNISGIESKLCFTLYDQDNCLGTNFTFRSHFGVKLDKAYNRMAASYNSCAEFKPKKEVPPMNNLFSAKYLQIFENEDHTGLIFEAPITETCTTPRQNTWNKAASANTDACVILFSQQYCQGFQTKLFPGGQLDQSLQKRVVSFMACEDPDGKSDIAKDSIEFYDHPNFDYVLHKTKLNGSCQQLPQQAQNRAESVKTGSCVILFASDSCNDYSKTPELAGFTLKVEPNEGNILPIFNNVAKSFQSCESYKTKEKSKSKVTFYGRSGQSLLIEEQLLTKKCRNLENHLRKNVDGVEANQCMLFYSEMECMGKNFTLRPNSGVRLGKYFNRMAASFNSCAEFVQKKQFLTEDLSSLPILQLFANPDKTEMILNAPIKEVCTTPKKITWNKTASVSTETCVQLYTLPFCQGFYTLVYPHTELDFSFAENIVSFTACENIKSSRLSSTGRNKIYEDKSKNLASYWNALVEAFNRFVEATFS